MKKQESAADYRSSSAIARSDLWQMRKSPMLYKYALEHPSESTPALLFGSAFHKLALEPDVFFDDYFVMPKLDARTKDGKAEKERLTGENLGKIAVSEDDFIVIRDMVESLMSCKLVPALLKGEHETSYYWTDELTGLECKCRPDVRRDLGDSGLIVDLKSCESAQTEDFIRAVVSYGYDLQSAMYSTGVQAVTGRKHEFVFIAVEKKPPYAVNILRADEIVLKRGYDLMREYLGRVKACTDSGVWYGYNGFSGEINTLGLPAWIAKELE